MLLNLNLLHSTCEYSHHCGNFYAIVQLRVEVRGGKVNGF